MIQLNLGAAVAGLKESGAKRVLVQIPEGLKTRTEEIAEALEGFEAIINMDPCFGACDLKDSEAERLGCDAVLHIGHSKFSESKMNAVYAPLPYELKDFEKLAEKLAEYLKERGVKSVGLTTTIQFVGYMPRLKEMLAEHGINASTGAGKKVSEAQLLGCNYSAADVKGELLVYLGDGLFHPLGAAFAAGKDVVALNPFTGEVKEMAEEKERFLKQRISLIVGAKEMKKFGVLVSTKKGQCRIGNALEAKRKLEENGKNAFIYSADTLSPESLLGIKADVLVNTACPRIATDDFRNYRQIVLNYFELDYLFGKSFDDYSVPKEF